MSIFKKKKKHRTAASYKGKLLCAETPFAVTEAYNTLRANLMYTCVNEKCPVFGVVSSFPNSGKSLNSANLAIAFSMMNKKVLLIDGDMRKPVQHKCFDIDNKIGLSELLSGQATVQNAIKTPKSYSALSVITSGNIPPNPQELLASDMAKELFAKLKEQFDVIIVDFPPVSVVSDAMVMSGIVSGYLFVILQGVSDTVASQQTYEAMKQMNCRVIGTVLNGVDLKSDEYYKGRGKYYSYQYQYKAGDSSLG